MATRPTRLTIIGCGDWSNRMHLPALKKLRGLEQVEFSAVCDLNETAAKAYAAELGAGQVFLDASKMLETCKPDGVAVLVPPPVAGRVLELVIGRRVPFIVEKPPAPDSPTHRRLTELAAGLTHVVAYNRRHSPYIQQALAWMKGQELQTVTCHFSRYKRMDVFDTTAVHGIDTCCFLAGAPITKMRVEIAPAPGSSVTNYFLSGWTSTGTRVDLLVTPNTASAVEHYFIRARDRSVIVSFPQGSMMDVPGWVELHQEKKVFERKGPDDFGIARDDLSGLGGILAEHRHFVRALRGEETPYSTLATALQTQLIREAIVELLPKGGHQVKDLVF